MSGFHAGYVSLTINIHTADAAAFNIGNCWPDEPVSLGYANGTGNSISMGIIYLPLLFSNTATVSLPFSFKSEGCSLSIA